MRAFIVKLENRPGTLAELGEALGERGINISGLSGTSWDGDGALAVISASPVPSAVSSSSTS